MAHDINNKRRFALGRAGFSEQAIEVLQIDGAYWQNETRFVPGARLAAVTDGVTAGAEGVSLTTPDTSGAEPRVAVAGFRLVMLGGAVDTVLRITAIPNATAAAIGFDLAAYRVKHSVPFYIEAANREVEKFAVNADSTVDITIESGGLAEGLIQWMLGV